MAELERTQVYLTRSERSALARIRRKTGVTLSELVRRAIDRVYLEREHLTRDERLKIANAAAGAWTGRTETGAEYVERLRSGRVSRLHKQTK
jgi:uncharacterized protein YciW